MLRLLVRYMSGADWLPPSFHAASAGVWFAPAILLMRRFSPVEITGAMVLVVGAARLLSAGSGTVDWARASATRVFGGAIALNGWSRTFGPSLAAAAGLQAAVAALLMRRSLAAAALFTASAGVITVLALALGAWSGERAPNLPRSIMGLCLAVLLAVTMPQVFGTGGFGGAGSGGRAGARRPAPVQPVPAAGMPAGPLAHLPGEALVPGGFPGVILWPEISPTTALVAPLPVSQGTGAALARPYTIVFGGEYWMYRWPFPRPPGNSFFQRGTPDRLSFSTLDHMPLEMEAHQKLEQAIDLRCCGRIGLDILNADRSAPDISLELVLIGRHTPVGLSLGLAKVMSIPRVEADQTIAVAETLEFPVPSAIRERSFDEFEVIFRRAAARQSHSARIAIQRFVLMP
jgi:hypothetical protein